MKTIRENNEQRERERERDQRSEKLKESEIIMGIQREYRVIWRVYSSKKVGFSHNYRRTALNTDYFTQNWRAEEVKIVKIARFLQLNPRELELTVQEVIKYVVVSIAFYIVIIK